MCTHTHKGEYYSVIKRMKFSFIFPFVATWVDLEGITLSKISQIEKQQYSMLPLKWGIPW